MRRDLDVALCHEAGLDVFQDRLGRNACSRGRTPQRDRARLLGQHLEVAPLVRAQPRLVVAGTCEDRSTAAASSWVRAARSPSSSASRVARTWCTSRLTSRGVPRPARAKRKAAAGASSTSCAAATSLAIAARSRMPYQPSLSWTTKRLAMAAGTNASSVVAATRVKGAMSIVIAAVEPPCRMVSGSSRSVMAW